MCCNFFFFVVKCKKNNITFSTIHIDYEGQKLYEVESMTSEVILIII